MKRIHTLLLLLSAILSSGPLLAQNYFAGHHAGLGNLSTHNTFVGYETGAQFNRGPYNSFFGHRAGFRNSTGNANIFIGALAGTKNYSGAFNSFLGSSAGSANTTGSRNVYVGALSGVVNLTGIENTFVGYFSGGNNRASYNTFVGFSSGGANTNGTFNSFFGYMAGSKSTLGIGNSFIGAYAGDNNSSGIYNSFLGYNAGKANTTGSSNVFVGTLSGFSNLTGRDNTFLGYDAGRGNTASANTYVGSGSGRNNRIGSNNLFAGYQAGRQNTSGSGNTFSGYQAGQNNATGNENSYYGFLAGPSIIRNALTNATAIGSRAMVANSNSLVLGSINGINGATASTNVGIWTTTPSYPLHVNASNPAKIGGGVWHIASDKRLKQDITEFKEGLAIIEKMKPVWFSYNGKAGITSTKRFVGVIAQEMQQIAPYTVGEFIYQDTTGTQEKYLDYDANAVTYLLINAVKEQQQQIEAIKAENQTLMQELASMKQELLKQQPSPGIPSAAKLGQNEPNPTDGTSLIRYTIPENAISAQLKFYSLNGQEVHSMDILRKGVGSITLNANFLASGVYIYHLFVDGQSIGNKKMIVTR